MRLLKPFFWLGTRSNNIYVIYFSPVTLLDSVERSLSLRAIVHFADDYLALVLGHSLVCPPVVLPTGRT
jgi:hypothetical protein